MPRGKTVTTVTYGGSPYSKKAATYMEGTKARREMAKAIARAQAAVPMNVAVRGLQMQKGEFKSVEASGNTVADTTGAVTLLNGIARGDDINERIGREVLMKSIQLNARFYITDTTGTDQMQRLLIVYDRQANAAALTGAQVLTTFDTMSFRNLENRKRFKILLDKKVFLNAHGEPGGQYIFEWYRRLRHPVTFNSGDAGSVADIVTGSMYALTVGSNGAGVTAGSIVFKTRIRYLDA